MRRKQNPVVNGFQAPSWCGDLSIVHDPGLCWGILAGNTNKEYCAGCELVNDPFLRSDHLWKIQKEFENFINRAEIDKAIKDDFKMYFYNIFYNAVESTHRLKFSYRMNRANRKLKKIYRKYGIPL